MKTLLVNHKKACTITLGVVLLCAALAIGGVLGFYYLHDTELSFVEAANATVLAEQEALEDAQSALSAEYSAFLVEQEEIVALETAALLKEEEDAAAEEYAADPETDVRYITINGHETAIDCFAPTLTWIDADEMRTEVSNTFTFGDFSGYMVWLEGQEVSEGDTVELNLSSLSQAEGLELIVYAPETGVVCHYYIRTLHADFNSYVYSNGAEEGYYYYTSGDTIYKMDTDGNVVYYKSDSFSLINFRQTIVDGVTYYSYLEAYPLGTSDVTASQYKGVVMNDQYEVIDVIEQLSTDAGMPDNCILDSHEFMVLGEGHYIIGSYVYQEVDNVPTDISADGTSYVQAAVVQEIKDGELVFQWCSTDYEEFYYYSIRTARLGLGLDNAIDYVHYNATAIDPDDGNFIFSFRAMCCLVKVDRETGEIIWILSGEGDDFDLTEEQEMSYQHYPLFYGDTITVFDNGTEYEQTRALEYVLDEETMTLVEFNSYQVDGMYSASRGSAQRLDDDEPIYLMGWGECSAGCVNFTEINFETGEILFQVIELDFLEAASESSYRVYKFDS